MLLENDLHCFWHQEDSYTLTSYNYVWAYPKKPLTSNSICVIPEVDETSESWKKCNGVCTDYAVKYRDMFISS
jgi:hypothetical protein